MTNCNFFTAEQSEVMMNAIINGATKEEAEKLALEPKKEEVISVGIKVNLHGSFFVGRNAKQIKHIYGDVIKVTDKAFCVDNVTNEGYKKTWVPKSALYNVEKCPLLEEVEADLRKWFTKK